MAHEQSSENPFRKLREQVLQVSASQLGLQIAPEEPYGVLMETGYPKAAVTLLSLGEGTTSLYFSNGGGIIGGIGHASVRAASQKFISIAGQYSKDMKPTKEYPLPEIGQVRFYVLTPSGVRTYQAQEDDLGYKRDQFWPLFYSGQEVLTELRLTTEARKTE